MKITIIGTGYVDLVTGACLAEMGNHVLCLDVDAQKIRTLESGALPIHEPGLLEVVQRNVAGGRLQFTTDICAAADQASPRAGARQPARVRALPEHQRIHGSEVGSRHEAAKWYGAQAAGRG